jgi:lambda family phage portal protein
LVRDNAYAWNVVDTIVSNVVGDGITAQSTYETPEGEDVEDVNDIRDKTFAEWCEVADINGELTFAEIQILAQREMVEAGEVLIRKISTPNKTYKGITRPVPFALELIEADRISMERDTFATRINKENGNRVIRGVELDDKGKPVAYWIYPEHPNSPYTVQNQVPERINASEIIHLYRKDRVGQTRGVTWFAPVMSWMRDLGVYVDNEIQASAVASCFGVAIKSDMPIGSLMPPNGEDTTDTSGNSLEYLEPAMVVRLRPGESVESINPGRPNSASEPWINLMLRGICAGTGTNYEAIAKDFSKTSYSSSRSSKLEDRPRYKRGQNYMVHHCCLPVWDEFCNAAARAGLDSFPTSTELLEDRRKVAPVEWQLPEQEWVDPMSEQQAAESSLSSYTDTYQNVLGSRGLSFRSVFYQRAKEERLRMKLRLLTPEEKTAEMMAAQTANNTPGEDGVTSVDVAAQALNGAQVTSLVEVITQVGTGAMPKDTAKPVLQAAFPTFSIELIDSIIDPIQPGTISADGVPTAIPDGSSEQAATGVYMGLSTQQWNRNRKAIQKTLDELAAGTMSEAAARVFLASVGMPDEHIEILIKDASDGVVDNPIPANEEVANV